MYSCSPRSTSDSSWGTASPTLVSEGRLRTSPSAPSSVCSITSTTVRQKFGSRSEGPAIRSWPRALSIGTILLLRAGCVLQAVFRVLELPLRLDRERDCFGRLDLDVEVEPGELGYHLEQISGHADLRLHGGAGWAGVVEVVLAPDAYLSAV